MTSPAPSDLRSRAFFAVGSAFAGLAASASMYWMTGLGPGVSPDSTFYLETARSLSEGEGFFADGGPMTHWAPAYPVLLAWTSRLHDGDVLRAARTLGAILFGANLVLFAGIAYRCTERSVAAAAIAASVFLSSASVLTVHSMAWSEAPFLAFLLAAILLLSLHLQSPSPSFLVSSSLAAGLAMASRYAGVALLPLLSFAHLVLGGRPLGQRIRDAAMSCAIASAPLAAWMLRNTLVAHTAADRTIAFHPPGVAEGIVLVNVFHGFVLPVPLRLVARIVHLAAGAVLFLGAFAVLRRSNAFARFPRALGVSVAALGAAFSAIYLAFLAISCSFFDAATPVDSRILLPALLTLALAAITTAWSLARVLNQRFLWYGFAFVALVSVSIKGDRALDEAIDIRAHGRGYTSESWRGSEVLSFLASGQDPRRVYSNDPAAVRFWTRREAETIPMKVLLATRSPNGEYGAQIGRMARECSEGRAVVAYFTGITWRTHLPTLAEVRAAVPLPVHRKFADGIVFAGR